MTRTKYYVEGAFGAPSFAGPDELMFLGEWVTADIQLSPLSVLEAIDLVTAARTDPGFVPEDLDGNAHTATISPQGVRVENHCVEHVRIRALPETGFEIREGHTASAPRLFAEAADLADAVAEMYSSESEDAVLV
ncbi:hypothetical protein [Streptomyces sp. NPDC007369]|uniref:hypothetical protein n=1 Tax=Streptomyces sp. NPDC007369 TaxID=3154589 RepID=UPI0033FEBB78